MRPTAKEPNSLSAGDSCIGTRSRSLSSFQQHLTGAKSAGPLRHRKLKSRALPMSKLLPGCRPSLIQTHQALHHIRLLERKCAPALAPMTFDRHRAHYSQSRPIPCREPLPSACPVLVSLPTRDDPTGYIDRPSLRASIPGLHSQHRVVALPKCTAFPCAGLDREEDASMPNGSLEDSRRPQRKPAQM